MQNCGISAIECTSIYGVRKTDIDFIKLQKNWVNVEEFIKKQLTNVAPLDIAGLALGKVNTNPYFKFKKDIVGFVKPTSPYVAMVTQLKDVKATSYNPTSLNFLTTRYVPKSTINVDTLTNKFLEEIANLEKRYPLLSNLSEYHVTAADVAEYINLIDDSRSI